MSLPEISRGATRSGMPLKALRAFEAASRHLNFRSAAEELRLTPSAVSHQIRILEQFLQCRLFTRSAQGVVLTDAGKAIAPDVTKAFDIMQCVVDRQRGSETILRLSAAPVFASAFLMSRLDEFESARKGIRLQLQVTLSLIDIANNEGDVGIRYGRGRYSGLFSERLVGGEVAAVCSPDILGPGASLEEIQRHNLISDTLFEDAWSKWFARAGDAGAKPLRQVWYDSLMATLDAARDGAGIALAPLCIVQRDIKKGRLVRPHPAVLVRKESYHLVCRRGEEDLPRIRQVRSWVKEAFEDAS